jgi:hypothetical protein
MKNESLFGYLAAFITIVLAIALSDMLVSMHRLLIARDRVAWSTVPLAAALFIFLGLISEFFSVRVFANVATVPFAYLVLLVSVSGLMAMAAFAVLPDEVPAEGLSLWDSYLKRRAQFWCLIAVAWFADIARYVCLTMLSSTGAAAATPHSLKIYIANEVVVVGTAGLLAWRKERWVHAVGIVLLFAVVMPDFLGWSLR